MAKTKTCTPCGPQDRIWETLNTSGYPYSLFSHWCLLYNTFYIRYVYILCQWASRASICIDYMVSTGDSQVIKPSKDYPLMVILMSYPADCLSVGLRCLPLTDVVRWGSCCNMEQWLTKNTSRKKTNVFDRHTISVIKLLWNFSIFCLKTVHQWRLVEWAKAMLIVTAGME